VLHARNEIEIESAFATVVEKRVGALVVTSDELFNSRPEQLVALTARHMLLAVFPQREFVMVGGLMSYGGSLSDMYRKVAVYTGRNSQGGESERFARDPANESRTGHQRQDCQDAGSQLPDIAARPRRRGD
jgi:hypothetical protein